MATIELDDATFYFERTGHGPAIVFVHGSFGDADAWADQAERLSDRHTCVRYDRRGHSRSTRGSASVTDAEQPDHFADAVRVFADELDRRATSWSLPA